MTTTSSGGGRTLAAAQVEVVDPRTEPRWDRFVDEHSGSLYHCSAWQEVLHRGYGDEPLGLLAVGDDGRASGVLPLMTRRGLLAGTNLVSLPHTPFAGPLAVDGSATAALFDAAVRETRASGARSLLVQPPPHAPAGPPPIPVLSASSFESTYLLDLTPDPDDLALGGARNRQRLRWSVRRAEASGVRVVAAESEADLRRWYRLYLEAMRRHISPAKPYRFFRAAWHVLRETGRMEVLLAEAPVGGRRAVVAGSVFWRTGSTVSYAFNGSAAAAAAVRANDALQWDAISRACRDGFEVYDFGEVLDGDQGLAAYKTKWGGRPVPLLRYRYDAGPHAHEDALPAPPAWTARLAPAWQRVPLRATGALGSLAYRVL